MQRIIGKEEVSMMFDITLDIFLSSCETVHSYQTFSSIDIPVVIAITIVHST